MKNLLNLKPSEIHPYEKNPRKNDEAVDSVVKSIKTFGFQTPILTDEYKIIIAGHTRWKAAPELDLKDVPVVITDELSEEQKKGFRIADNRLGEKAQWDAGLLLDELNDIDEELQKIIGFEKTEIEDFVEQLLNEDNSEFEGLTDEDEIPEKVEPICKTGDLWKLGNHRLMCGNATNAHDAEKLMAGQKANMVFTDPPYNCSIGTIIHPKFKERPIENDNMTTTEYRDFCDGFISILTIYSIGCIYVCHAPNQDGRILASLLDKYFHCSTTIIWVKDVFTLGRGKYQNKYEPIWFGWVKSGDNFSPERNLTNVWEFDRPKSSELHPTMKPVELIQNAIKDASKPTQTLLDIFCGSGSTIIACQKTNRICYGMEIDSHYCDVIIKRWEDFTGQNAELIND